MKKLLATILALVMALGLCSVSWAAAPVAYVAEIVGGNQYATLQEAIDAAGNNATIKMIDDSDKIMDAITCAANKTLTIDLNGHSFHGNEWAGHFTAAIELRNPGVNLTIKNGTIASWHYEALCVLAENCKVTLENVDLISNKSTSWDTGRYGIATNGSPSGNQDSSAGLQLTLKNCTLTTNNTVPTVGIYFPVRDTDTQAAKLEIIDTKITGFQTGVQVISGAAVISGSKTEITGMGTTIENASSDGARFDGAAVSIIDREGYGALKNIAISGGTFTAANSAEAVKAYKLTTAGNGYFDNAQKIVTVSGGTFSNSVNPTYLADGLKYEVYAGGKYSYYSDFDSAAAAAAAGRGEVIKVGNSNTGVVPFHIDYADGTGVKPVLRMSKDNFELPTPTRSGYTFKGWKVLDCDGTQVLFAGPLSSEEVKSKIFAETVAGDGAEVRADYSDGVTLIAVWSANSYYYYPSTSDTTTSTTTKGSPKTFDAGVGIYAVTALLSVTGMAWAGKKRH